ncbi:MAG: hypothetical protein IKD75_04095, partial [Prevotella sp.]|nr:hypothetical protein [Prevotella sp.]
RIAAETQRDEAEQQRINAEQNRVNKESQRETKEQQRITAEQGRVNAESARVTAEQARVLAETLRVNAEDARAAAEINRNAAEQQRITNEQARETQYAADHTRAEADHETAVRDNAQMTALVERADADHVQAESDHTTAVGDHTQATNDHETATSDHTTAAGDHTQATNDHTRAENDHETATSDHETAVDDHELATQDHATYAGDVLAARTAAESAEAAATASAGSASQTEQYVEDLKEAIENLPDGQAVTEQVAQNVLDINFIEKSFGKYDAIRQIVLQQAKSDKYVNTDGGETTASGYGISAPITLNAGDILLIPSAQAVPASVSVVARMVQRTYQKVIAYIYTYRTDYPELPATATADYDATLVYTAVYDESGDTPVLTGWTRVGQAYTTLPATREVSEQFYEPLVRQAVSAMPSTGYYIYLSPTAMTVVVSGLTATVSGGTALVVGWGIFKNITTNFVGAPGQSVLAQAFAVLFAAIDGLKAQLENLGETKAASIDFENSPKLCGQDMYLTGDGAPASPNVPTMVGQEYLDVTNKKCYKAFSVTGAISDWVLLN